MTAKERIFFRIQSHRTSLAESCRSLSAHMLIVANELESDKPHARLSINDLGEIQARGTTIDAECGRLMGKVDVWSQMEENEAIGIGIGSIQCIIKSFNHSHRETLSIEQADKVCSNLDQLYETGVWVVPDWASDLANNYKVEKTHDVIQLAGWQAAAKAYQRFIRLQIAAKEIK